MKNKGFTLVEVIVAIAILGVITLITVPNVVKLQQNNNEKTIKYFGTTLINSAKAYINDNRIVINPNSNSNVTCNTLVSSGYAKQCKINGYTCTTMQVNIARDSKYTYTYTYTLTCKKGNAASKTYTGR